MIALTCHRYKSVSYFSPLWFLLGFGPWRLQTSHLQPWYFVGATCKPHTGVPIFHSHAACLHLRLHSHNCVKSHQDSFATRATWTFETSRVYPFDLHQSSHEFEYFLLQSRLSVLGKRPHSIISVLFKMLNVLQHFKVLFSLSGLSYI